MIRRYLPLLPIEAGLLVATKWSWTMHEQSWYDWATWYIRQPTNQNFTVAVFREPVTPLAWLTLLVCLSTLVVSIPLAWHIRVKRQLSSLCPNCGVKLVRRSMVSLTSDVVRLEKTCPQCGKR